MVRAEISHIDFQKLYEQWGGAVRDRDADALREVLAPDYLFTTPEGQRFDREQTIEIEMKAPPPESIGGLELQTVTDDVVIVRGQDVVKGQFPEEAVGPELAAALADGVTISFTSVWRRQGDFWQVVSNDAHVTGTGPR